MSALPTSLPTPRDENWKYANLRGLSRTRFEPSAPPSAETLARVATALPAALEGFERFVIIDGFIASDASGVERSGNPPATSSSTIGTKEADRYFLELNRRLRSEMLRLEVARHQKRAVEVIVVSLGTSHPAIEVALSEGAELSLIERHVPISTDTVITNLAVSAIVGPHARLDLSRIAQTGAKTQHVETIELHLGEGSTTKVIQLTTGGAVSRTTAFVDHAGCSPRSSGMRRRSAKARSRTTRTFVSPTQRPAPKHCSNSEASPPVDLGCRSTGICEWMPHHPMRNPTNL